MSALTPEQEAALRVEARRRVTSALHDIEAAQYKLGDACATLSSLCHGLPEWKATGAMADKVKKHWYRVRNALELSSKASKVCIDSDSRHRFLERLAADKLRGVES